MAYDAVNSLRPRPNRRHFADDIFKYIFENDNEWISPRISLKFVPKVRINNIPALFQIMAWCQPGDKPLSEQMMVRLPTHICVTRPQWVKCWKDRINLLYIADARTGKMWRMGIAASRCSTGVTGCPIARTHPTKRAAFISVRQATLCARLGW